MIQAPHPLYPLRFILLALCILTLKACSLADPPESVVSDFWSAALIDDTATIERLAVPDNFNASHFHTARYHELFKQAVIGDVSTVDGEAMVRTHLQGHFQDVIFDTITVIYQGRWRVDYAATINEMIAALLSDTVTEIGIDMQNAVNVLGESLDAAIHEDWRALDRTLKEE